MSTIFRRSKRQHLVGLTTPHVVGPEMGDTVGFYGVLCRVMGVFRLHRVNSAARSGQREYGRVVEQRSGVTHQTHLQVGERAPDSGSSRPTVAHPLPSQRVEASHRTLCVHPRDGHRVCGVPTKFEKVSTTESGSSEERFNCSLPCLPAPARPRHEPKRRTSGPLARAPPRRVST